MPRKKLKPRQRRSLPVADYRCKSVLVSRFINKLDYRGKKSTTEKLFYKALDIIKEKTKEDPLEVFNRAMSNVRPLLEVRARRVGGATYQVPMEVPHMRSTTLAMRWIISYSSGRNGKSMSQKLAQELIEASRREGASFKKKEDTHRMAEANKAFAHYRW